jgi:hypothetical protein
MRITRRRFIGKGVGSLCGAALAPGLAIPASPSHARGAGGDSGSKFKWRIIEPWLDPDGKELFAHGGNVLTWDAMLSIAPDSALGRFIAQVHDWGFNGMSLYCDPATNPPAFRSFCRYLKSNGIRLFIRREWNELELGKSWPVSQSDARPRSSPKLSPYNPEAKAYWENRIKRDYEMFPEIAGYRMNATEFYFINGAPWMGEGPGILGKTGRECAREAITLVAGALEKYGGTLFWETCQDDPSGQRHEFHYFRDLAGEIPANALIVMKQYYWDFHPGWPRHPLYDALRKDKEGNSPYLTSVQLPGEYTGMHDFPWCLVDDLSRAFLDMVATGQQGVWVMAQPHPDGWDHPLNKVNWYAVAHLLDDPHASPAALKLAWAREQFGAAAAPTVVRILETVTEAAKGMYEFDALWTAAHSRFPTLEYLDSHLCGPYRQTPRMKGMMGLVLPVDMYSPQKGAEIRANPKTRMVFGQCPITPQLKAEAMAQKDGAVTHMREAVALWKSLKGKIDSGKYDKVLAGLEGNLNDTIIFRHMMDIYMDWKLGVLTEAKIAVALDACRGLKGLVVPEPLDPDPRKVTVIEPASLKSFAEQLRRDLREPWVERYWQKHPIGASVVEPIKYADEKE